MALAALPEMLPTVARTASTPVVVWFRLTLTESARYSSAWRLYHWGW